MSKEKRNKFSIEEKERVVRSILKENKSYNSVARELKTSHRLISLWVNCYKVHGKSGLSMKNDIVHSGEFKLSLLHELLDEGLSLQQLSVKYLIPLSVISTWKRQYEQDGAIELFNKKRRGKPPKMKKKPESKQTIPVSDRDKLLKENERLRAENDYLKKLRALIQKQEAQEKG